MLHSWMLHSKTRADAASRLPCRQSASGIVQMPTYCACAMPGSATPAPKGRLCRSARLSWRCRRMHGFSALKAYVLSFIGAWVFCMERETGRPGWATQQGMAVPVRAGLAVGALEMTARTCWQQHTDQSSRYVPMRWSGRYGTISSTSGLFRQADLLDASESRVGVGPLSVGGVAVKHTGGSRWD